MNFKAYSKWNNIVGWLVFAIAAFTYLSTMERTVSLWDCGEFVSASYKLQVPHPPGAPMFILINRIFTLFAGDNKQLVPIMVNASSALCSAFTILFLFWSISALAIKMLVKDENNIQRGDFLAIMAAAVVGGLAYTFSDTFWFSAVEGEVYAMSSMFTALVFWLALKWERRANEPYNLRWIVLIFYLIGVVIGVHLLGLLVIPVIVLMYYYKKYAKVTPRGIAVALAIGFAALGIVQILTIQWLPGMASQLELLLVNSFGMPMWSGIILFFILLMVVLGYFIIRSQRKGQVFLNLGLVCFTAVILGYTSYASSVIRAHASPSINMGDPSDVFNYISYLARDQYGDNYLTTGPYYTAFQKQDGYSTEPGAMQYRRSLDRKSYEEAGRKNKPVFNSKYTTVFPRMFHSEGDKIEGYRFWAFDSKAQAEQAEQNDKISFVRNNLRFFWDYQMNYMYFRYFAWNFIGRQNDVQGVFREFHQGNWITGIDGLDKTITGGSQNDLPARLKDNKARNKLYGLPLILGILGMVFQYRRNRRDFFVVGLFFFMTGIAIELYLNMPSPQPRERDYAFVGSFYVYAIWIGLGVLFLYDLLRKRTNAQNAAIVAGALSLVAVPVLMAAQEWDDHDRSKRTASLDYGVNYLESCLPNSVLFCNGDNDTYPLWYAQEVEGIRDDIRIVNLSLFGTDLYINQMRKPINDAPALSFTLKPEHTKDWEYLPYLEGYSPYAEERMDVRKLLEMLAQNKPENRYQIPGNGERIPYLPTKRLRIPMLDKDAARKQIRPDQYDLIPEYIDVDLKKNNIMKNDIMVLDFITTNQWKNPIYFSITSGPDEYLGLTPYMQREGLTYRLMPIKVGEKADDPVALDATIMYNNVKKWRWGKLEQGNVLMDYVLLRQAETLRGQLAQLCQALLNKGDNAKALEIADMSQKYLPHNNVPINFYSAQFVSVYYKAGAAEKARKMQEELAKWYTDELNYYSKQSKSNQRAAGRDTYFNMVGLQYLLDAATDAKDQAFIAKYEPELRKYNEIFDGGR